MGIVKHAAAVNHLSMMGDVLQGVTGMLERLHLFAIGHEVFEAWPELQSDLSALGRDVAVLVAKIKGLA